MILVHLIFMSNLLTIMKMGRIYKNVWRVTVTCCKSHHLLHSLFYCFATIWIKLKCAIYIPLALGFTSSNCFIFAASSAVQYKWAFENKIVFIIEYHFPVYVAHSSVVAPNAHSQDCITCKSRLLSTATKCDLHLTNLEEKCRMISLGQILHRKS